MNFKRIAALLLAIVLAAVMVGCAGDKVPEDVSQNDPSENSAAASSDPILDEGDPDVYVPDVYPVDGLEQITVDNPITYFSLTVGESYDTIFTLNAFDNDDGRAEIEYTVDEKKVGKVSASVMHSLTAAFEESGLPALNGTVQYSDEPGIAFMYICYADGTVVTTDISGKVPQEFLDGFEKMKEHFQILTANIPLYVPTPQILGAVDAEVLEEMLLILNYSGLEGLDTLGISDVAKDDYFAFTLGLSNGEGIATGTVCNAMMMTTPYSLVIVKLENAEDAEGVCQDFKATMNWRKWVCVAPTNALIARKGNMVLCLMGSSTMYSYTAAAVKAADWTEVEALKNPDR